MGTNLPVTFVEDFSDEDKVKKMIYTSFGLTGLKISKLSIGAGAFGGSHTYGDYQYDIATQTVINAIKNGINFIDGGVHYGKGLAETFLGSVLKNVPRNAYYISTKVGRCGNYFNFSPNAITESFEKSLERLQLEYVDIVFVHDVEFAPSVDFILNETLPAVENFVKAGKAKFIGVSGYPLSTLLKIVEKSHVKIDCILTYCRDALNDNTLQDFLPSFQAKNVAIINAGCIGMRLLSNSGPPSWHPASRQLKDLCKSAAKYCYDKNVELGKLALYHSLNQPGSCTCLVGINNTEVLQSNLNILWNGLNEIEVDVFQYLKKKYFPEGMKSHWEGVELELFKKGLL